MKFIYASSIIFLMITGCHNTEDVQKNLSNTSPVTTDESKILCSNNTWSITGNGPNCTACPNDSTVNKTNTSCECKDTNMLFHSDSNECKVISSAAKNALLLM